MNPAKEAHTLHLVLRPRHLALAADRSSTTLVITHIPKTGGTTLREVFKAVASHTGIKIFIASGTIYRLPMGEEKTEASDALKAFDNNKTSIPELIIGHLPFGSYRTIGQNTSYAALIRNPIDRCVSHFKHGIKKGLWNDFDSLKSLHNSGSIIDNIQTRMISGQTVGEEPCTEETLALAKLNLEREYLFAAIWEDYDKFLALCLAYFDGSDVIYGLRQMSPMNLTKDHANRIRGEAEDLDKFDIDLFHWMKNRSPYYSSGTFADSNEPLASDMIVSVAPRLKINGEEILSFPRKALPAFIQGAKKVGLTISTSDTSNLS